VSTLSISPAGPAPTAWRDLSLDFANTVSMHAAPTPEEHLNHYTDLVAWAQAAGLCTPGQARRLLEGAAAQPAQAQAALDAARALREAIYALFVDHAHGRLAQPEALARLNAALGRYCGGHQLRALPDGFAWTWEESAALDGMLGPVAQSAAELLTSPESDRVRQCAAEDGCGWLFYDTSRNRSRRWCDMGTCGNKAKAQRHYRRMRAAGDQDDIHR
jgi:predicted RNA-binding Zn ribbon-like protein